MLRIVLLGVLVAVGTMGCSGGAVAQDEESAPDWFLNPSEVYDEDRYLMAVASGPSAQAAQDQAFGNLARVFEADIDASQELREDYQEVTEDGDVTGTQQETRMITRSDIQSDQKLLNSEVLEQAEVEDTHYALVGMERQETIQIYAEEIESNRKKIEDYRSSAEGTDNPITRLAFLRKALVLAQVNERLTTQRNIVAGGGAAGSASSPVTALEKAVRAAQEDCAVVVSAANQDVPSSVRTQVAATLEAVGFRVVDQPGNAILEARVTYEQRPTLESRDAEFLRWTLSVALTDQTTAQTLETFTTERRDGGMSKAAVERKAHATARKIVEEEFNQFLTQTFLNIDT